MRAAPPRISLPAIRRATKAQSKGRIAIAGPSNSGKTTLALETALALGQRILLIDTEHGSASKYADVYTFETLPLDDHDPRSYVAALDAAEAWRDDAGQPLDVIIIDSLTHAWDRLCELVDEAASRSRSGNSFQAWGTVGTPLWRDLIHRILRSRCHIIVTARTKTEYVIEEVNGKKAPRKVGTAPQLRAGAEYEFDVFLELDIDHRCTVAKTRCRDLDGQVWQGPRGEIGEILAEWLSDGVLTQPEPPRQPAPPPAVAPEQLAELEMLWDACGYTGADIPKARAALGVPSGARDANHPFDDLSQAQAARLIRTLVRRRSAAAATTTQPASA
jgi:hypothetical protein